MECEREVWRVEQTGSIANLRLCSERLPAPAPGEVRVRVHSLGLNFADVFSVLGLYSATPSCPFVPGLEYSGIVQGCGAGVDGFDIGDRVLGVTRFGGYATHINSPAARLRAMPAGWPLEAGAAFACQGLTAFYALFELGHVVKGDVVLVHSAAGGVGLIAMQLLDKLQAHPIATVGRPEKKRFLLDKYPTLHPSQVIVRSTPDALDSEIGAALLQLDRPGINCCLDSLCGDFFTVGYRRLVPTGKVVIFGAGALTPRGNLGWNVFKWLRLGWQYLWRPRLDVMEMVTANKSVLGFNLIWLYEDMALMERVYEEMESWELEAPHIGHAFPFAALPDALRRFQSGETMGKVVVLCNE